MLSSFAFCRQIKLRRGYGDYLIYLQVFVFPNELIYPLDILLAGVVAALHRHLEIRAGELPLDQYVDLTLRPVSLPQQPRLRDRRPSEICS